MQLSTARVMFISLVGLGAACVGVLCLLACTLLTKKKRRADDEDFYGLDRDDSLERINAPVVHGEGFITLDNGLVILDNDVLELPLDNDDDDGLYRDGDTEGLERKNALAILDNSLVILDNDVLYLPLDDDDGDAEDPAHKNALLLDDDRDHDRDDRSQGGDHLVILENAGLKLVLDDAGDAAAAEGGASDGGGAASDDAAPAAPAAVSAICRHFDQFDIGHRSQIQVLQPRRGAAAAALVVFPRVSRRAPSALHLAAV